MMRRMPTRARRLAAAVLPALAALVALATSSPVAPAGALEQGPGLRVEENQTVEQVYPPIPGQNPVPQLPEYKGITPADCKLAPYCHLIPLEVIPSPTLTESDEFFVTVELTWETERIPEGPTIPGEKEPTTNEMLVNDVDLYVWDDPIPEDNEFEESSATPDVPEVLRMYRPTKGKYQILVLNYSGPNRGYKLKVSYEPERFEAPFELLEPPFQPPVVPAAAPLPPTPPVDESGQDAPLPDRSAGPAPESPETTPSSLPAPAPAPDRFEPVTVDPDPDFADFADSDFDEALAAPAESDVLRERRARAVGPAEPASAGSLVFWLVLVPALFVIGGGCWLARRGSAVLRFR